MDREMNMAYGVGLIAGLVAAGIIITVMSKTRNKEGKLRLEYDERQRADRKASFAVGFGVLAVLDLLMAVLRQSGVALPFDLMVETVLCCLVASAVSVVLCIHREAWLSLREKPGKTVWLLLLLVACNGFGAWVNWKEMWTDGVLNFRSTNLFVAVFMAVLLLAFCIKRLAVYLREIHDGLREQDV